MKIKNNTGEKVIFSNVGHRTRVSRAHHIGIAVFCSTMLIILIFLSPNYAETNSKFIAGFIALLAVVGLVFTLPWVLRFKKNVTATDRGIGFDDQFFSWAEVTRLKSWFGGRIDVYVERDSKPFIFCFGIPLNREEFQEGYKAAYAKLQKARDEFQSKS